MKTLPALLCLLSALLCFSGCGTLGALRAPFITSTNAVPLVVTVPAQTNSTARIVDPTTNTVGHVVPITPAFVTNYVTLTPAAYVTNWATNITVAVNPALESALATVASVNRFNPTPSAPFIDLALVGLSGFLGFWGRLKTKQAAESSGLARTLVLGIEEAKSAETKAAVQKFSAAAGNAPQLNALVQRFTRT